MHPEESFNFSELIEARIECTRYLDTKNVYTAHDLAAYHPEFALQDWHNKVQELVACGIYPENIGNALTFYPELTDYDASRILSPEDAEWINNFCTAVEFMAYDNPKTFTRFFVKDYNEKFANLSHIGTTAYLHHLEQPELDVPKLVTYLPEYVVEEDPARRAFLLENMPMIQALRRLNADIAELTHYQLTQLVNQFKVLDTEQPDFFPALEYMYERAKEAPLRKNCKRLGLRFYELDAGMRSITTSVSPPLTPKPQVHAYKHSTRFLETTQMPYCALFASTQTTSRKNTVYVHSSRRAFLPTKHRKCCGTRLHGSRSASMTTKKHDLHTNKQYKDLGTSLQPTPRGQHKSSWSKPPIWHKKQA
jgi:hypothetical protein